MSDPGTGAEESRPPSPEESLAIIDDAMRRARQELSFNEAPFYRAWGLAWLVAFGGTHLVVGGDEPVLGGAPEWALGLLWMAAIGGAAAYCVAVSARQGRGVGGRSARMGARMGIAWTAALAGAAGMIGLLGLQDLHHGAAVIVFTVAVLYVGQGTVFLDDVQLGTGLWLLALNLVALALGPDLYHLLLAVLGGGAFLAAAQLARRRDIHEHEAPARVG